MSDLCARLQDVNESGVYQLSCPVEVVRANVALAGFKYFEIDLDRVHGKGEFLAEMARAIHAPDWFGHNFDALADALGDLSWLDVDDRPAKGYVTLLLHAGDTLNLSASEHETAMDIFNETAAYWKAEDKPFWVFLA